MYLQIFDTILTMKLVAVFSSMSVMDVQLAKTVLESEGIQSYIPDYHISSIAPHYIPALSGIKLNVREQDYHEAKKILDDYMGAGHTEGELNNDET
ncbi:MAG: hypothetical protein COS41_02850 [Elusimicrobia bacterium CG03_land_8_20_14_0_80_50_18]|nr:MAG: hypothetical protein COS41_02850 [Elusimicrobia bacterium CG03_land_8_20_14_0_80_50_18]